MASRGAQYCFTAALVGALSLAACGTPEPTDPVARFVARVQTLPPEILETNGISGASIAVVGRDGVVWSGGFGTISTAETSRPVDADTLFSIQSITKVFTATTVLLAVQDGILDLDRPITDWLPDFRVRTRFESHPEQRITLRLLLSHRSGLAHHAPVGNNFNSLRASFREHLASIPRTWLRYPVGSTYAYSNLGIDLAGAALAAASGTSFEAFVGERLLGPLGMQRSSLDGDRIGAETNRAAPESGLPDFPVVIPMVAAGNLYSSANELARYVQLHLREGRLRDTEFLTPASLAQMYRVPSPVSAYQTSGYALGLAVGRRVVQGRQFEVAGHDGGGAGFKSSANWSRDLGLGYVVLQNLSQPGELLSGVRSAFFEMLDALAQDQPLPAPAELESVDCLEWDEESLSRFEGVFQGRYGAVTVEFREGVFGIAGRRFTPLCFVSEDVAVEPERGFANSYRITRGPDDLPLRVTGLNSGTVYDYNDGPNDPSGEIPEAWRKHLGVYTGTIWGVASGHTVLHARRGHLYLNHLRLRPGNEAGIFFAGTGATLDLRTEPPTFHSMPLRRVARADGTTAADDGSARQARDFVENLRQGDFDAAVAALHPETRSPEIRSALEKGWSELVALLGPYAGDERVTVQRWGQMTRVELGGRFEAGRALIRIETDASGHVTTILLGPKGSWWTHARTERGQRFNRQHHSSTGPNSQLSSAAAARAPSSGTGVP